MAADRMTIDEASLLDNLDAKQVEFTGEVDDEDYDFAVQYDVLEALSGDAPDGDAEQMFMRFADAIGEAGLVALQRDADQKMILISENDLE